MNQPYPEINYRRIFSVLPNIMGFPMIRKGARYFAPRYLTGEISARHDKMAAWLTRDIQPVIMIAECGGDCIPLYKWLIQYGNCADYAKAHRKLLNLDASNIVIPEERYRPEVPIRYVYDDIATRTEKSRQTIKDNLSMRMSMMFGKDRAEEVLRMYRVGSIPCRIPNLLDGVVGWTDERLTIYWYINAEGKICHDKRILYAPDGHRVKTWTGRRTFKIDDGYRGKTLFGAHLLDNRELNEKIYIVEAEKSAIMARIFFNKGIWLACGGINNLHHDMLRGGEVLIADKDAHDLWSKKFSANDCPRWWEAYASDGYQVGDKSDIGDMIEWLINNKKEKK